MFDGKYDEVTLTGYGMGWLDYWDGDLDIFTSFMKKIE